MKKIFLIIFISILFSSCNNTKNSNNYSQKAIVKVVNPKQIKLKEEINTYGTLSYINKANITSSVDGKIKEIFFDEGDKVYKNNILCKIENIQLDINYSQAEANIVSAKALLNQAEINYLNDVQNIEGKIISLEKSKIQLDQKKIELEYKNQILKNKEELYKIGGISSDEINELRLAYQSSVAEIKCLELDYNINIIGYRDIDIINNGYKIPSNQIERKNILTKINTRGSKAQIEIENAKLKEAEAQLFAASELLKELTICSPISGIIGSKSFDIGEKVQNTTELFIVFNEEEIDVIFEVPEDTVMYLKNSQKVKVEIDTLNEVFEAKIRIISPIVDPESGNIIVKAKMPISNKLIPGMFARINLTMDLEKEYFNIPQKAIINQENNEIEFYVIINNRVFLKKAQKIKIEDEFVYLQEGVKDRDKIVIYSNKDLVEGEEVEIN